MRNAPLLVVAEGSKSGHVLENLGLTPFAFLPLSKYCARTPESPEHSVSPEHTPRTLGPPSLPRAANEVRLHQGSAKRTNYLRGAKLPTLCPAGRKPARLSRWHSAIKSTIQVTDLRTAATILPGFLELSLRRRLPLLSFVGLLAWSIVAHPALASDPPANLPVIEVKRSGPVAPLAAGGAFYLTGDAENAKDVHVLFVRAWHAPWGIGTHVGARRCQQLRDSIEGDFGATTTNVLNSTASPRVLRVDEVFAPNTTNSDLQKRRWTKRRRFEHRKVLVTAGWHLDEDTEPPKGKDGKPQKPRFTVFVPKTGFFRPGANYCMFVLQGRVKKEQDEPKLKRVVTAVEGFSACLISKRKGGAPVPEGECLARLEKALPADTKESDRLLAQLASNPVAALKIELAKRPTVWAATKLDSEQRLAVSGGLGMAVAMLVLKQGAAKVPVHAPRSVSVRINTPAGIDLSALV